MAVACVFLMSLPENVFLNFFRDDTAPMVNIGCGKDLTIKELDLLFEDKLSNITHPLSNMFLEGCPTWQS